MGGPKFPPKVGAPIMGGPTQTVEKHVEPPQPTVDYQPIFDSVARGMELIAQIEVGID